jgi:hypothetical protein
MEHATGVSLHEKWSTMDVSDRLRCVGAIVVKLKEVVGIDFTVYGSLFFADMPYLATRKLPFDAKFRTGPHCGARYWNCNISQPRYYHDIKPNQGPCK